MAANYRASERRYRETPKGKAARKRAQERYDSSERGKAANRAKARRYRAKNPERVRATRRRAQIKKLYGMTEQEYDAVVARGCAICGAQERICLDHDHAAGVVRDALCADCNRGLGQFRDSPELLVAAARYIEHHANQVEGATE